MERSNVGSLLDKKVALLHDNVINPRAPTEKKSSPNKVSLPASLSFSFTDILNNYRLNGHWLIDKIFTKQLKKRSFFSFSAEEEESFDE